MATEEHGRRSGFPLVSGHGRGPTWTELLVGDATHVRVESIFIPTDGRFGHDKDDPVGSVTITHGKGGHGPFSASFTSDDGSEAVVSGRMPGEESETRWLGRTTVHVDEGTGGFEPWVGQDIPLESENPKRWG